LHILVTARYDPLQPLEKYTTHQHYLSLTACAAHPNICTHAVNRPFIAATGVLLSHLHPVARTDILYIHTQ
jgi:hypothetical protein